MAAPRTIRELLVALGVKADTAAVLRFDRGINQVKAGMTGLVTTAAIVTTGLAAVAGATIQAARATARYGDENAKAAKRVGVTATEMQELTFAAEQSGAGMGDVETSLRRLAANAVDASNGIGEAKDAFAALGITSREDLLAGQLPLLEQVAEQMRGLATDQERAALAQDIFGRGGSKILPLLNEGASGIRKLRQQAHLYGRVMSEDAVKMSERFTDALNEARSVLVGIRNTIGIAVMPSLIRLIERFRDWFLANREVIQQRLGDVAESIGRGMERLGDTIEWVDKLVRTRLGGWSTIFKGIGAALTAALGAKVLASIGLTISGIVSIVSAAIPVVTALAGLLGISVAGALGLVVAALANLVLVFGVAAAGFAAGLLVWGDFFTFLRGGRSVLGALIDTFADSEAVQGRIAELWQSMARFGSALGDALARLGSIVADKLTPYWQGLLGVLQPVFDLLKDIGAFIVDDLIADMGDLIEIMDTLSGALERWAGGGEFTAPGLGQALGNFVNPVGDVGRLRQAGGSVRNVSVGGTSVTISGAGISATEAEALTRAVIAESNREALAAVAGGNR